MNSRQRALVINNRNHLCAALNRKVAAHKVIRQAENIGSENARTRENRNGSQNHSSLRLPMYHLQPCAPKRPLLPCAPMLLCYPRMLAAMGSDTTLLLGRVKHWAGTLH